MKNKSILGILSSVCTLGVATPIVCSCASNAQSLNKSIEDAKEAKKQEYNKNIKAQLSNPKDKYGIDKVIKINGDEVYQNVFRFRTNEADTKGGRNITKVDSGAFQGNRTLQHVSYSYEDDDSSVKLSTIEKGSFQACQNLETIKIPSSCTSISERAFFRCEKLSYIDMSSFNTVDKLNALTVGTDAFRGIAQTGAVIYNSDLIELSKQQTEEGKAALTSLWTITYNLREQGVPDSFFNADYVGKTWSWSENDSSTILNQKWKTLSEESNSGSDNLKSIYKGIDLIGKPAYVNINGLNHAVRIIDIDHDNLSNDMGKATLTFEFINPICDDKGYSLGTLFNNVVQDPTNASRGYTSSILRNNLDRNCETSTTATRWYQKGMTHQSDGTDNTLNLTDKTALDMIKDNNTNLYNSIVPVTKNVATSTDSGSTFTISPYDAKLFVNTAVESFEDLGNYEYAKGGNTYEYWKKNTDKLNHVVKDIANKSGGSYFYEEVVGTDAANSWCMNWAGVNMATDQTGGCFRWTSSSGVDDNHSFWISGYGSCISNTESGGAMLDNYSITPCFCIGQTLPTITTTSWEDFITDVNKIYSNEQTAKEFAQHYTIWNSTTKSIEQATEIENLVGQQRFIKINNLDHRVRIIGTQHDTLTTTTVGSTTAIMTFELINVITDSSGCINKQYGSNNVWSSSIIRTWLQSDFKNQLEASIGTNAIKNVIKKTSSGKGSSSVIESDESIWTLSLSEMASSTGITNSSYSYFSSYANTYIKEGTQYEYYKNTIGDGDPHLWNTTGESVYSIKKDINDNICAYWLRSPRVGYETGDWYVNTSGYVYYGLSHLRALAPAFCI